MYKIYLHDKPKEFFRYFKRHYSEHTCVLLGAIRFQLPLLYSVGISQSTLINLN